MRVISPRSLAVRLAATTAVALGVAMTVPVTAHADTGAVEVTFTNAQGGTTGVDEDIVIDSGAETLDDPIPAGSTGAIVTNDTDHAITVTAGNSDPTWQPGTTKPISWVDTVHLVPILNVSVPAGL